MVKFTAFFLVASALVLAQDPNFVQWTNNLANNQLNQRAATIANITSVSAAEARKSSVHAKILQLIGNLPQSGGALNAQLTGLIDQGAYTIEKIQFESMPGLKVSANVYVPKSSGPHPGVLFQVGHFTGSKAYDQVIPGNLALKGFVVLVFDPIGQGERLQGYDPATGTSLAAEGVEQHLMAGGQSLLMGQNF